MFLRMALPASPYIDQKQGALRITGTRVSLSSVVAHFREGRRPEQIIESFPTVTLAQAYGAIGYYLENRSLIDEYIAEVARKLELQTLPLSRSNPRLFGRLQAAREKLVSKGS